jgi:hypothetical protein
MIFLLIELSHPRNRMLESSARFNFSGVMKIIIRNNEKTKAM